MRFYVIKSKFILFLIFMFGVMAVLSSTYLGGEESLASVFFYKPKREVPIYCVDRSDKKIALTFDAAWGSDKTQGIINCLVKNNVKATFFLVGMWVDKNPELVKTICDSGFEIGTHSNLHPDFNKLDKTQIELELKTSVDKIKNIIGKEIKFFRAPFGSYNNLVLNTASSLKLKTIQWDVDSLDWKGVSSEQITKNIITKTKSGSIILCHNNADNILGALDGVINNLKSRGYKFVTLSELVYEDNFYIDNTGKQIKNI